MNIGDAGIVALGGRRMPDPAGLPDAYRRDLRALFALWAAKLPRDVMRSRYYHGRNVLKNIGIAVPPDLTDIDTVVGWPQKAVDALAVRSRLDAFTGDEGVTAILDEVCSANDLLDTYRMLVPSQLTHSCAALTVNRGEGEIPEVRAHSAISCAMLWDFRLHRLRCACTVAEVDSRGVPVAYNLYEPDATVRIWQSRHQWRFQAMPHPMGRPMVEPLVYRASLDRPFGVSRISRAVMSITDSAMRTALRAEIGAELFTSPQKVILGAPESLFQPYDPDYEDDGEGYDDGTYDEDEEPSPYRAGWQARWEAYLGSIMAISRDGEGNIPQFLQVAASSMEPHIGYLRSLAARFSGATCVPISELGIVQDNPSSAEAIYAAKEGLIIEAEALNEANGKALANVARMALAVAGNKPLDMLTAEERAVGCHFMNPARPSLVSQADAMVKQASAFPGIVNTRVYWEELGYTDDQVDDIMAEVRRSQGEDLLRGILAKGDSGAEPDAQ